MSRTYIMLAVPVLFAIVICGDLRIVTAANASECSAGEKIDGSSAESARVKMQKAGFPAVRGLKKGCDNFWHGSMLRDGQMVHVVLSPQGQVMVEGN